MNGKKVLITGASGMLGSAFMRYLEGTEVIGLDKTIDITNKNELYAYLKNIKIDVLIHTAAYTDVEGCEKDPDKAYGVNTLATQHLVNYCIDTDILFVYISSTGIYGNTKTKECYTEFDDIEAPTVHHRSKYEGEKVVCNHLSKFLIIRTGWLYGGDVHAAKNFVYKRYLEAKKSDKVFSDATQIGNPTYVLDLIKQIEILIMRNEYGIFNCVNGAKNVSRWEYVQKIVDAFALECEVVKASDGVFKRIAPVSKNESACNYKLTLLGLNIMREWDEALEAYITHLKSEL